MRPKTGECACGREGRLFQGRCFACWRRRWPSEESSGENNDNGSASGARATLDGGTMSDGGPETSDEQPLDQLDPEVRAMIPDGWKYDEIAALCEEYDGVYPVADELGVSRSKGAFLLRKLGLLRYVDQSDRGDSS